MVNIHVNDNTNPIRINVNPTFNSVSSTIGNETFYNGLAKEWAISPELVQGEDYSAKYYAGQAKQAEQTATEAVSDVGAAVEDAQEYAQTAQEMAEYIVNNAPTVTVEQTSTGAIVTATDLQGTTTATILNGAKGDKGDTGEQGEKGETGAKGDKGDTGDDGYSPTATVSKSGNTATITITDKNGTTTANVYDGVGSITDVQVDGTSVLDGSIAKIDLTGKYDASNPNGYTSNVGTVTSVNNTQPDANGNVTIPTGGTVDQTYDGTSANAQSGVAINGAGFLQNTATGNSSITVNGTATTKSQSINIGTGSQATGNYGTALGAYSFANASHAVGIGNYAKATADYAIQLNKGTNNISNSLCVGFNSDNYQLLDGTTGLIPDARISSNIARTTDIPTIPTATSSSLGIVKPDNTTITIDSNGVISSSGASRNVGEIIQSTIPLTDAGLHLLDGTLLQYGIYKEFIDYIADLYAENPTANYFTDETTWQNSVTQYGSCGKFVYDSVSKTVRLPKVSDILQSTTDINALGDLIEAGLPNIKNEFNGGRIYTTNDYNGGVVAPFIKAPTPAYLPANSGGTANQTSIIGFDASLLSTIYGNSTTVQPQAIKAFVYIVIANSTKTSIQVDIDNIATDLNNKAGTDLANVTDTGKILMSEMGMPSDTYVDLTLGASGSTYTAPANGWIKLAKMANGDRQYLGLFINNVITFNIVGWNGMETAFICPVLKGDIFKVQYSYGGSTNIFRFIYAQGSESEAS